jgi:hypothetical protein
MEAVPLATLLSWVWTAHVIEVDNAFEVASAARFAGGPRPFRISLVMWANALRLIDEDGVTVDDLHARARATGNVPGLERWGWIVVGDGGPGRRAGYGSGRGIRGSTILRPTRAGRFARRVWPQPVDHVETRWQARFGTDVVHELRAALGGLGPSLPWAPPIVNPADGFCTSVLTGDTVDESVPLVVFLGQALTSLTLEHERGAPASLPLAANFLRVLGEGAVRIRDLPARSGLSKECVAMATGYLLRTGLANAGATRTVTLSDTGHRALADHRRRGAVPANARLRHALGAVVSQTQSLREGLRPAPGCWRAEKPYLAQTERTLADPTGALPWQPMGLHRGGWPDGS